MENVVGVFTAFLFAVGPLAVLVERGTMLVRMFVDSSGKWPSAVWIIVPFVLGVALCVGWEFNFVGTLAHSIPALADSTKFDGIAGQLLTGLAVGAAAGPWHEKLAEVNMRRKAMTPTVLVSEEIR